VADLNQAVVRMTKMVGGMLGENIQLTSSLGEGLGMIAVDLSQIERVLLNLVINAKDAMPDGGKIVVETANVEIDESSCCRGGTIKPGRYVLLTVSDTGRGMNPEIQSRIFEPYFTTKAAGNGTGLGLSTVDSIVKQCGGGIGVDSHPGAGTTFKVYFPRFGEVLPAPSRGRAEPSPGGEETILLVEDSAALRGLMRRILEDNGYATLESGDPAAALRIAEAYAGPLPLLIADLELPGFSGTVLAERIAAARPETRVLYMSGYNQESAIQFQQMGQNQELLEKPFSRGDLLAKVRHVLDTDR
jgi:CheY-like chemotaxis protein